MHTSTKINKLQLPFTILLQVCPNKSHAPQMPNICHMPKLLDFHLWRKYANILATYEVASIDDVTKVAVHRQ